jgi:serine/threonine-protein kinase RsbW
MPKRILKLPSSSKSICQLEQFIGVVATQYEISKDKYPDILISLTEAVNNAIIHGNKEDQSKFVEIELNKTNQGITFVITDQGLGFNPQSIPDPTRPENIGCCGGRGVFLMKQLADGVRYMDNGRKVEIHFAV